jgi:hypothetical protein
LLDDFAGLRSPIDDVEVLGELEEMIGRVSVVAGEGLECSRAAADGVAGRAD